MTSYVYALVNLLNGKMYIGKSDNPSKRFKRHINSKHSQLPIHRALRKYGREAFDLLILKECKSSEEAYHVENQQIIEHGPRSVLMIDTDFAGFFTRDLEVPLEQVIIRNLAYRLRLEEHVAQLQGAVPNA